MTADEIREARNQYAREWRRQHPDRTREIQEKYWAKRAAVTREMQQKGKLLKRCACAMRPQIVRAGKQFQVRCPYCGKTQPPVADMDQAVEIWNRTEHRKKQTMEAAAFQTPEDR